MSIVETEHVLVIPTDRFRQLGYFQGFCSDVDRYVRELFDAQHTSYRPRGEMETDPGFKQLIPYVIFRNQTDGQPPSLFCYTRGKGQGESRLHSKLSIGVGGHISSVDQDAENASPYQEGMRRELEEEVIIETEYQQKVVGLINDDQTEVGQVHLGVVHLFDVESPHVHPREDDILEAGFRPVAELLAEVDRMESWSSICIQALFGDA